MADSVPGQKLSLKDALYSFHLCLSPNKEIDLGHYVAAWQVLVKFLNSLLKNEKFIFIYGDAVAKIKILVDLLNGENGRHYRTIRSMIQYELENQLVDLTERCSNLDSGCRTLLRLHRVLKFLELFFDRLRTSTEDSKTSDMCTDAYNESLAKYHPDMVCSATETSFIFLPNRQAFFEAVNVETPEQVVAMLGEAVRLISEVHQITEDLYAEHNMLDLP